MNLERNTDEFLIKKLKDNLYMKFGKSNENYQQDVEQILNLFKSTESSDSTNDNDVGKGKYIFIRLYNPVYDKKISPTNILKRGQYATVVNNVYAAHAAINYDLKDKFWGLTGLKDKGQYDFAIECCSNPTGNTYMETCNVQKSTCSVYCIRCKDDEYSKCKNLILKYARNHKISYDVVHNFIMALSGIKRKFFTKKDKRRIGRESLEIMSFESEKQNTPKVQEKFVCSTLVAYFIYSTISTVRNWFNNHNVNYNHVTPSDIVDIRGVKKLFTCKWCDYNKTISEYVKKHPEFNEYK